jgi:[CysO sulfur-carrier protein]-S-L-cysteine hydrolase
VCGAKELCEPSTEPIGPAGSISIVLRLPADVHLQILSHCLGGLPDEACGLLGGRPESGQIVRCYPTRNAAASARIYTVEPKDHLHADLDAEKSGLEIMGVFHSHTHSDAYPSPTDVAQAPDPTWHYVLVSLRDSHPVLRSYRIIEGQVDEESVVVAAK